MGCQTRCAARPMDRRGHGAAPSGPSRMDGRLCLFDAGTMLRACQQKIAEKAARGRRAGSARPARRSTLRSATACAATRAAPPSPAARAAASAADSSSTCARAARRAHVPMHEPVMQEPAGLCLPCAHSPSPRAPAPHAARAPALTRGDEHVHAVAEHGDADGRARRRRLLTRKGRMAAGRACAACKPSSRLCADAAAACA